MRDTQRVTAKERQRILMIWSYKSPNMSQSLQKKQRQMSRLRQSMFDKFNRSNSPKYSSKLSKYVGSKIENNNTSGSKKKL